MKRAALIVGVSIISMVCAGPTRVVALPGDAESWWGGTKSSVPDDPPAPKAIKKRAKSEREPDTKNTKVSRSTKGESETLPPIPHGPLHIIISIDKQRATLFANGVEIADSKISSGTPGHPTPMGVFTVIQKSRHHVSNLYDAPMPYMQRITWSGSALHEGPLPGRPASHGCVRLTTDFAKLLWRATKIGARVIITHDTVAPVDIDSAGLFAFKPKTVQAEPEAPIKTADATNAVPRAALRDVAKPPAKTASDAMIDEPAATLSIHHDGAVADEPKLTVTIGARSRPAGTLAAPASIILDEHPAPAPAPAPAATAAAPALTASHRTGPVSVFISRKAGHLYVRQGWEPVFDMPITIEHPEQPIGTHVYTAMGAKADGTMRWTVVSIPSGNDGKHAGKAQAMAAPSSASAALARIVTPPEAMERIAAMITPGSSLIVSDNKLSGETGSTTDFIVLTQ